MIRIKFLNCFWLAFSLFTLSLSSCDDNTDSLGESMMPNEDQINIGVKTYQAYSQSLLAGDSILARTSTAYLGKYTDPVYGTFESDFLAQFHCVEDFQFPEGGVDGDSAIAVELRLFYTNYFGDPNNPCHLSVYPLDSVLQEEQNYYTDINPTDFYDESLSPLASRPYTAIDQTIPDSIKTSSGYVPYLSIKLPRILGTEMIRKYYEDPANFKNAHAFINNVCKGFYIQCDQGDGTILYIQQAQLNVKFQYKVQSSSGKVDSLITVLAQFAGTQEVLQLNHFQTDKETLKELAEQDGSCTYLKTPAGIFTEVTLPIEEIATNHIAEGDTLNAVNMVFVRYHEGTNNEYNEYRMGVPQTILMVRKQDMYTFFENNSLADNETAFLATFDEDYNTYTFSNITKLIRHIIDERENSTLPVNADWNKVVLIPVKTTSDTSGSIVNIRHDLQLNSARLFGGYNGTPIDVNITYSKFKN